MNASGCGPEKVKRQQKIGGLRKNVGCYGPDGVAKVFRCRLLNTLRGAWPLLFWQLCRTIQKSAL
jgi:hypothetical protein